VSRAAEVKPLPVVRPLDRRSARRRAAWRRRGQVLAFMSPWLLGFTIFFGYPLVMTAYYSFTHYDLLSAPKWVGLANYRYLFTGDQRIWPAVSNTLWIIAVAVPLNAIFAFGVAVMLSRARRGIGFLAWADAGSAVPSIGASTSRHDCVSSRILAANSV